MKLIERYIFRRTFTMSVTTLVGTTMMVLITQVLIYVNVLTDSGQAIATFAMLALTLVPAMITVVAPFALYVGATQTLNTMNSDSELAVIEAAGGSQLMMAKPIILLAGMMSLAVLANSVFVEPWSNRNMRDIITNASANLVRFAVQSGTFKKIEDKLYIQIAEQLPTGEFGGIFLADMRDPKTELIYYAKRGSIQTRDGADIFALSDGEVQRKNPETGEISIITFESYLLDFNQFGAARNKPVYYPKEQPTPYLFAPDPNDRFLKTRPKDFRAEVHRRFSDWLYPLAFGLVAVYFAGGARSNRQERLWGLAAGAAVAFGFRGLGFFAMNNSGIGPLYAIGAYAVPLSCIVIFGSLILLEKTLRIPQALVERMALYGEGAQRLWDTVVTRNGAAPRPEGRG